MVFIWEEVIDRCCDVLGWSGIKGVARAWILLSFLPLPAPDNN